METITTTPPPSLNTDELHDFRNKARRYFWPNLILLVTLLILFTVYFSRVHEKRTVQMGWLPYAAQHFSEDGFLFHRLTPPFTNLFNDKSGSDFTVWYTHYPPLPYYLGGLVWELGGTSKFALAIFINTIAIGYLLLFYAVVSLLLNPRIACMATIFQAAHAVFISQVLENYLNLSLFFQAGAFLCLILALEPLKMRWRLVWFFGAWVCLFCDAFSTFDQILASSFFVFAYTFWRLGLSNWKKATGVVALLATASISAFMVHLLTNAWFFGSFDMAVDDLIVKTFLSKSAGSTPFGDQLALEGYPTWLITSVWQYYGIQTWALLAAVAALVWTFFTWGRSTLVGRRYFIFLSILFIANATYWVIFAKLNRAQFQWVNASQMLPTFSLLLAGAIYFMWLRVQTYWRQADSRRLLFVVPSALLVVSFVQVREIAFQSMAWMNSNTRYERPADLAEPPMLDILTHLDYYVPKNGMVAIADDAVFCQFLANRPHVAHGYKNIPFPVMLVRPNDRNSLFKLESMAQHRKVFFLINDFQNESPAATDEELRAEIMRALKKRGLDESQCEEYLAGCVPTEIRPNWTPVTSFKGYSLYQVAVPEEDDLFPTRADLPTRLAISGLRVRDNNELQVVGWVLSPARITNIKLYLDDGLLGYARYPLPDAKMTAKLFNRVREWYGMQDWPLPTELIKADYPEYGDNTSRFVLTKWKVPESDLKKAKNIVVKVFCGDELLFSQAVPIKYEAGNLSLADPTEIVLRTEELAAQNPGEH